MVLRLNKGFFQFLFLIFSGIFFSQEPSECQKYQDRKHFSKKAKYLAAWQIQQLKNGAVVIRVPDEYNRIKQHIYKNQPGAAAIRYEKFFRKYKSRYRAFLTQFSFCKFYFVYSRDYPRLLKGERSGFFLDSTLCINDTIRMNENFFMILEEDDVYASTLGFVKESCADKVFETGLPSLHADWVFKNKYGHQVKEPFPLYVRDAFAKKLYFEREYRRYMMKLCDTTQELTHVKISVPEAEYREDYQYRLVAELQQRLEDFYYKQQTVRIPPGWIDEYKY